MDEAEFTVALVSGLRAIRGYARLWAGERWEDLLQDVALKAWRGRRGFDGRNMVGWLTTIARNAAHAAFRSGRASSRCGVEVEIDAAYGLGAPGGQDEVCDARDIQRVIDGMPYGQRMAILTALGGGSYEDMALELGVPEGTLKSQIHRARNRIADSLAVDDYVT